MKVVIALNMMSLSRDLLSTKKIIHGNELNLKIYGLVVLGGEMGTDNL